MTEMRWNPREEAVQCFLEIMENQGYSSIVLDRRVRKYPPSALSKDKALVTGLVYTTLSMLLTIDTVINQYSKTPVRKMKPYIAAVMRITTAQLLYFDRIPARAAIHEAVELVKHSKFKGLSGFVNGVLRAMERGGCRYDVPKDPLKALSIKNSVPEYMLRLWEEAYGIETAQDIAERCTGHRPVIVRCNTLKCTPDQLYEELTAQVGVENVHKSEVSDWILYLDTAEGLGHWEAMRQGHMIVQDESSALAALAACTKPGMQVLDMCAAPGGKSACMAAVMENQGRIVSCDIHEHKLELIRSNAQRLGISIIEPCLRDGTVPMKEEMEMYDVVLLDAPCSGLGIMRSKPDIRWNRKEEDIEELAKLQRELIKTAVQYVKPGGRLIYSTCTITPQENEENAQWILDQYPNFVMGNLEKDLPSVTRCDIIKGSRKPGWCTILPQKAGRDGFFISSFIKKVH